MGQRNFLRELNMAAQHILVVDDEPEIGLFIKSVGEAYGHKVEVAVDAETFKSAFRANAPDLIFLDVAIPECDGLELMKFLADEGCHASIFIISGHGDYFLAAAKRMGQLRGLTVSGTLNKPFRLTQLQTLLKTAIADRSPNAEPVKHID